MAIHVRYIAHATLLLFQIRDEAKKVSEVQRGFRRQRLPQTLFGVNRRAGRSRHHHYVEPSSLKHALLHGYSSILYPSSNGVSVSIGCSFFLKHAGTDFTRDRNNTKQEDQFASRRIIETCRILLNTQNKNVSCCSLNCSILYLGCVGYCVENIINYTVFQTR